MHELGVVSPFSTKKGSPQEHHTLYLHPRSHRSPAESRYLSLPLSLSQRQALQPPRLARSLWLLPPPLPGNRPHRDSAARLQRLGRPFRRLTPCPLRIQLRRRHQQVPRPPSQTRHQRQHLPTPRRRARLHHQPAPPLPPRYRPRNKPGRRRAPANHHRYASPRSRLREHRHDPPPSSPLPTLLLLGHDTPVSTWSGSCPRFLSLLRSLFSLCLSVIFFLSATLPRSLLNFKLSTVNSVLFRSPRAPRKRNVLFSKTVSFPPAGDSSCSPNIQNAHSLNSSWT